MVCGWISMSCVFSIPKPRQRDGIDEKSMGDLFYHMLQHHYFPIAF